MSSDTFLGEKPIQQCALRGDGCMANSPRTPFWNDSNALSGHHHRVGEMSKVCVWVSLFRCSLSLRTCIDSVDFLCRCVLNENHFALCHASWLKVLQMVSFFCQVKDILTACVRAVR